MTIYPAIDLRGGRCVRLMQGAFDRETVYGDDPVAVARRWEAEGATWLHVVEATFKSFARALDLATQREPRLEGVLSTKGSL